MDPARMLSVTTAIKHCRCLNCGRKIECITGQRAVRPGDLSVCIGCGITVKVTSNLQLRPLTEQEAFDLLSSDPATLRGLGIMTKAILTVRAERN
jgi:hypothetical protein